MENGERPGAAVAVLRTNFGRSVSQAVERGALASRGLPYEADEGITAHRVVKRVAKGRGGGGILKTINPLSILSLNIFSDEAKIYQPHRKLWLNYIITPATLRGERQHSHSCSVAIVSAEGNPKVFPKYLPFKEHV
jgi:hypothetical protein